MKTRTTRRSPTPHGEPPARWNDSLSGSWIKKGTHLVSLLDSQWTASSRTSGSTMMASLSWSTKLSKTDSYLIYHEKPREMNTMKRKSQRWSDMGGAWV